MYIMENWDQWVLKADVYEGRQNHFSQSCRRALSSSPNSKTSQNKPRYITAALLSNCCLPGSSHQTRLKEMRWVWFRPIGLIKNMLIVAFA